MQEYLPELANERRELELSQWFTPPRLAERIWDWTLAGGAVGDILEPAAGLGALLKPVLKRMDHHGVIIANDIEPRHQEPLRELVGNFVFCQDFLVERLPSSLFPLRKNSIAIENPPYENEKDMRFIERSFEFVPRVVGIFRAAILAGQAHHDRLWKRFAIARGVRLATRPQFGDGTGAKSDFVVLDIRDSKPTGVEEWSWWP